MATFSTDDLGMENLLSNFTEATEDKNDNNLALAQFMLWRWNSN